MIWLAVMVACLAPAPASSEDQPQPVPRPTQAKSGPLNKLRLRSARERWLKLKESLSRKPAAPQPLPPVPNEARSQSNVSARRDGDSRVNDQSLSDSELRQRHLPPRPRDAVAISLPELSPTVPPSPVPPLTTSGSQSDNEERLSPYQAYRARSGKRIAKSTDDANTAGAADSADNTQPVTAVEEDSNEMKKITDIVPYLDYATEGLGGDVVPKDTSAALTTDPWAARAMPKTVVHWEASNLRYNPLYFEDPGLERYGHTYHPVVQPFVSAQKFCVQLVGLPYQMAMKPIKKCVYPLGYYRPGECAPRKKYQIPLSRKAGLVQAGVTTGMFFLFP